jgi:transposase-like protein
LYSGTLFEARRLRPAQVVLLVRGVLKGESAATLARELGLSRTTITELGQLIQTNVAHLQTEACLEDHVVEADELFQNAGEKGDEHFDPLDPPRCRANKQRGRGTFANDRPPVLGVIGRETGQIRLRVVQDTKSLTWCSFVEQFTLPDTLVYTDEYQSYNILIRIRETICHGAKEWARDDDGDGWFETHTNSNKGLWTGLRNFLRAFRGVHKRYLQGDVAVHEFGSISRRFRLLSLLLSFIATCSEHEP